MIKNISKPQLNKVAVTRFIFLVIAIFLLYICINNFNWLSIGSRFNLLNVSPFEWKCGIENFCDSNINVLNNIGNFIKNRFNDFIDFFKSTNKKENINDLYRKFLIILLNFLNFFIKIFLNVIVNLILILWVLFSFYINGEHPEATASKFSNIYLKYRNFKEKFIILIKKCIKDLINYIKHHPLELLLFVLIAFAPYIFAFVLDVIIFLVVYFIRMLETQLHMLDLKIIGSILILIIKIFLALPLLLKVLVIMLILYFFAYYNACKKLRKNYLQLKDVVGNVLTQTTIVNGKPGKGKTLSLTQFALVSVELFIEDLEKELSKYMIKYPKYHFGLLDKHILNNQLTSEERELHNDYIMLFEALYLRNSSLFSNFSINDVYHDLYCKMLKKHDLEMGVFNPFKSYDFEERCVIAISEFDKFCNSHDKDKEYFSNGVNIFFSTISHALDRKVKVFVDYQQKDQVAKMCRGNAEWFLTIQDKKNKYPLLMHLVRLPFDLIYNYFTNRIAKFYFNKKRLYKRSNRFGKRIEKRFDLTGIILWYRHCQTYLSKIIEYFDSFAYFKMIAYLGSDEEPNEKKCKYALNIIELTDSKKKNLYHSTYLSPFYKKMRDDTKGNINSRTNWKGLIPSVDELRETGLYQRFFDSSTNSYVDEINPNIEQDIDIL